MPRKRTGIVGIVKHTRNAKLKIAFHAHARFGERYNRWFDHDLTRQLKSVHDTEHLNDSTYALDFSYDLAGNRTSDRAYSPLTFNFGGLLHAYTLNALNQIGLVETTQSDGPTIPTWLIWDANGNMTYDGTHLTFEWDAANRLSAVNHTDSGERTEFAYDGLGRRVKITEYGPGVTATIQPKGSEWTTFNTAPFTLPTGSYTLTFEGLISNGIALISNGGDLAIIDSVTLNSTLVDNGSFEGPEVSQSSGGYQYGPSGATWSFMGHAGIASNGSDLTSNNADAPDGRQAAFIPAGGRIYQTRSVSAGTYTLSFQAGQGGNNTGEQQVRVTLRPSGAAPKIKTFVWCGTQICEERDGTGAMVTKRFFAEGEQRIGSADAGNYYYSRDHLGSIREVTDARGDLQARYDYDAYGNSVVLDGKMNVDFGYTGHYFHAPSGLNLTLYRAYNPALGRWLSRDPIGEAGGVNLYGYVDNNPVTNKDTLGLYVNVPLADKAAYRAAWQYLIQVPEMRQLFQQAYGSDTHFIVATNSVNYNHFGQDDDGNGIIDWDLTAAHEYGKCGVQTPALALGHEFAHSVAWDLGIMATTFPWIPVYHNAEERRVIEGVEGIAARQLGEAVRHDHYTAPMHRVPWPTSQW